MKRTDKYDDIIDMPHHVSKRRAPMSRIERAAQFSPFAALVGFEAAIEETARLTDSRIELTEEEKSALDRKLRLLAEDPKAAPVNLIYFSPDQRKTGGTYITITGQVSKVDPYLERIVMADGTAVDFEDVVQLEPQ